MAKIFLILVATLLVASSVGSNGHDLKSKLMRKFGIGGSRNFAGSSAYSGGYGSSFGGSSSSASATVGGGYGGSYGSAASAASAVGGNGYGSSSASSAAVVGGQQQQQGGYMWGNQQQQQQQQQQQVAGGYLGAPAAQMNGNYGSGSMGNYGAAATAASSVQNYYTPAPAPVAQAPAPAPVEPQKPNFDINQFKAQQLGFRPYLGAGGVASSAAAGGYGGANSAVAAAQASGSYQQGGYVAPGTYAAASGTYANSNDNGIEQRHFSNEVQNMENHESGRADDDHYYHAQSYGKAANDDDHIDYNKNYENVMSTPNVYHSVKSSESLLRDHNKSNSETGSAVMAKDHHSAGFQKHQKHFHQNANSANVGGGNGGMYRETDNMNGNMDFDDEMYFDSDGLNNQGQGQAPAQAPAGYFGATANAAASGYVG